MKGEKMKNKIFITKPYLPKIETYIKYIKTIWESNQLTNDGSLVRELEKKLANYLGVKHLFFVTNGTLAIQLAIKSLELKGEIITTPFSYVATTSAVLWENCTPRFVDIEKNHFCIDPEKIEKAINKRTSAILAVHVYGYPCEIEKIEKIAKKHNLKVIYDAAHAFGTKINGDSVLKFGDISTLSFHATKLFHTGEGGAIITENDEIAKKIELLRSFGHVDDEYIMLGINARNSEFHAALGLANFENLPSILKKRNEVARLYDKKLNSSKIHLPKQEKNTDWNFSYYPVIFKSENELLKTQKVLNQNNIFPRRYFFPSLNTLPFLKNQDSCPISESIARKILCLPSSNTISSSEIKLICKLINSSL
jgi:dTDP-4-amino-4,6-dideoxygalactose transaminase